MRRAGASKKKLSLNVLMFGTSLMGQLADEMLCILSIKSAIDHRSLATVANRFTTSNDVLKPRACDPVCATHEFSTYSATGGGNLTTIINYPPLQRFSKRGDFAEYLETRLFHHVFFMIPHKECFFDWLNNKDHPFCVNTKHAYVPLRNYVREYDKILNRWASRTNGTWNFVIPWTQLRGYGERNAIFTRTLLYESGICGGKHCTNDTYHQCQPGPLRLVFNRVLKLSKLDV